MACDLGYRGFMAACMQILALTFALIAAGLTQEDMVRCPTSHISVHWADKGDAAIACEAAGAALGFLAANGLETAAAFDVHLVSALPAQAGPKAFGCYDHPARRVYMLDYPGYLKQGAWSDLPVNRALYRSLLAHEIGHAVAAVNFSVPRPSVRAHEYVAYITMLATMPAEQRESFLARFPGQGYESPAQMSTDFYFIAPFRFAAEAYRHFLKPGNGKSFLTEVLAGRALIGDDGP